MHKRQIGLTSITGVFGLPLGIYFHQREVGNLPKWVEVSTVDLEGGHHEDPLGLCEEEHGFETMVFLEGCSFFSLHTRSYKTRKAAKAGHDKIVEAIKAGKLPLAVQMGRYFPSEVYDGSYKAGQMEAARGPVRRESIVTLGSA